MLSAPTGHNTLRYGGIGVPTIRAARRRPRLGPRRAICLIDDFADVSIWPEAWNLLPGVKRACDEFFAAKPEKISFIYSAEMSHGYFRKC